MMTLAQAHALLPGSTLVGESAHAGTVQITRVHSDSRSLCAGDLFVALKGERFDAHDFLPQARAAGAVAALAERGLAETGLPGLLVNDTLAALQTLAGAWRARFHLPLIAVAGSNGKTTVTQMIASILRHWLGEAAFATEGNFNNHIGLPLTLLRLRQDDATWHRAAVVELGMNHPGEIAQLAALAAPSVALVNNAQREHQEFMATVEAAARENGAVISALPGTGVAVFPAHDEFTPLWRELSAARRVLTFALDAPADVSSTAMSDADVGGTAISNADVRGAAQWVANRWQVQLTTPAGHATLRLNVAGVHNVRNALAAAAAALAAGAPLAAVVHGLRAFEPVKGRSQLKNISLQGAQATLVDDSYNANPDSVLAAIEVLAAMPGPRWLVLGSMGEVGTQGPQFHAEVGARARERGIEHFWAVGAECEPAAAAYGADARCLIDAAAAVAALAGLALAPPAASVLVKGSRFMRMEQVVNAMQPGGQHAV